MVLIFEGADLSGKTTLARHYAAALSLPIVKIRWELKDEEAETVAFAKVTIGLLAATHADVILDRSFLSMWAYASNPEYMMPLLGALRSVPEVYVIVLTTDPDTLHRRYAERGDRFFSEERLRFVNERFALLPVQLPDEVGTLHLDTGRLTVRECCVEVDRILGVMPMRSDPPTPAELVHLRIPIGEIPVDVMFPRRTHQHQ